MSSNHETGHTKNVAHFEDLISFCSAYGSNYKPTKQVIQLSALQQLQANAINVINTWSVKQSAYKKAINARSIAFEPLNQLATRIVNAYEACGASEQGIEDVKYYVKKIQGRAIRKKAKVENTDNGSTNSDSSTHSSAQLSFDSKVDHLSNLINLLANEVLYSPNETDLTITALQTFLADLKSKNSAVITAYTDYSNAIIERDKLLYALDEGLVDTALDVKKYVKSIFGHSSKEFKQVSSIRFTK